MSLTDEGRAALSAHMRAQHTDPDFVEAKRSSSRERMIANNRNPVWQAKAKEGRRKRREARFAEKHRDLVPAWVPEEYHAEFLALLRGTGCEVEACRMMRNLLKSRQQ